jgi:adenylosuccinate synthase
VDPDVLYSELVELDRAGYRATERLVVDQGATVLTAEHRTAEAVAGLQERLGSTAKGIGGARVDRLWRRAQTVGESPDLITEAFGPLEVGDTFEVMERCLTDGGHVIIEGTQGYGLGLHTKYYPYTTSGDCRAIDFLAQAGLSPWRRWDSEGYNLQTELKVVVCFRPFPIRVAGNSGPMSDETTWDELGLSQEFTTVTRKVRRVGAWDPQLVEEAIRANGGPSDSVVLALTMADHVIPSLKGVTSFNDVGLGTDEALAKWVADSGLSERTRSQLWHGLLMGEALLGTGPTTMLGDI